MFLPLSLMARRRCHEYKPNQKDTDAGKWFLGAVEIPLLEAFEKNLSATVSCAVTSLGSFKVYFLTLQ